VGRRQAAGDLDSVVPALRINKEPELSLAKPASQSSTTRNLLFAGTATVATSAMLFWGTGLHPLWFLTWFAPLPVLLISPRLEVWGTFSVAALSWFLGSLNMWHYLLAAIALPLPLVLVLSVVPACLFGLAVLLFRRFVVRGSLWKAALVFPTFWVACEYVNNITSPHGTFLIMVWNVAFYHLCQYVLKHKLKEFNDRIPVRYPKKWKAADMPLIKKYEDFGDEMSEREVIEVCNSAGIITGDMYKIYVAKLADRNSAAHPSTIHVTQVQAEGFIDSLIRNTVLLLKI
jgi:hypothetical protein